MLQHTSGEGRALDDVGLAEQSHVHNAPMRCIPPLSGFMNPQLPHAPCVPSDAKQGRGAPCQNCEDRGPPPCHICWDLWISYGQFRSQFETQKFPRKTHPTRKPPLCTGSEFHSPRPTLSYTSLLSTPTSDVAINAQNICRLALPYVRHCSTLERKFFVFLAPGPWGDAFLAGEGGAVLPLLTGAVSAPAASTPLPATSSHSKDREV